MPKIKKRKNLTKTNRRAIVIFAFNKFQEYRLDVELEGAPEDIDDTSNDGSEYTVSSLLSAVRVINRFYNSKISKVKPVDLCNKKAFSSLWEILDGKTRDLTEKDYGKTNGSDSLSFEKIQYILKHEATSRNTPSGLLNRVFFYNAILFGGEHYTMMVNHFKKRKDGFDVFIYKSKTNQHGLNNLGSANKILIPANNPEDGVQKSALSNLMNAIDSNVNKTIFQNQPATTLSTKNFYQGFKFARQIYQANLVSSMFSTSTTQEASVEASIITPQPVNLHEFQSSKIPLQEQLSVANQNHKMQELLQRNLFVNSNITFH
ncbi:733_t:CDS:2, partial [Gigaspora rosea]